MYYSSNSLSSGVSTTLIVGAVVGSVLGLIFCIGLVVILVCVIKHCKKSNNAVANGMILQPYPPYPPYASYAPYPNYPNYPPANAPPYTFSEPEVIKTPPP